MKKFLALAASIALIATLATGCGSAPNATSADGSAAPVSSDASGKVKLEFFNMKTEIVPILEGLITEYEALNPNVDIELVTPADANTVLTSRMSSNDTPDIFTQWPNSAFFDQVDSGYVMDLSKSGIMDNVQDAARAQWTHNDGEYAATVSYNVSGVWYNEEMFKAAGITTLPTTWDELMTACKTLQDAGYTPFVSSGQETTITVRMLQVFLASTMGDLYDDMQADIAKKAMTADGAYAARLEVMANRMVQMLSYSQSDVLGTNQDNATANFANGKGAMMVGGSWLLASVTAANPDINISMMPIPGDTAADTNTCAYPGDMSLCVAKDTANADAATAFVKWMTSVETATKYAEKEGNPSCIKGVEYVAPQFEKLYADYVTTGKFILNPDCVWSAAQQEAAGAAVQQLYHDSAVASFASNLAAAFNDN